MAYQYEFPAHFVTTDIAVFTIKDERLSVLLIKRAQEPYKDQWALPGGFLKPDEELDDCAARELREETGVSGFHLEQLRTIGTIGRDSRGRVITVAYMALIREPESIEAGTDASNAAWFPVSKLPKLAFDHQDIYELAKQRLPKLLEDSPDVIHKFLPKEFTMRELKAVYEAILDKPLDRGNFYKKMAEFDLLQATGELRKAVNIQRPAAVFKFKTPSKQVRSRRR